MAEVVMDDMAIGNPAVPYGPDVALWASFPGFHIAQFRFQVIGNCGVIFPDAMQQSPGDNNLNVFCRRFGGTLTFIDGERRNCSSNCPLALCMG